MNRDKVYECLNSERKYQDSSDNRKMTVAEELILMEYYLDEAKTKWINNKEQGLCLDSLRKVAAIAVRCFENHGCPSRYLGYTDVVEN